MGQETQPGGFPFFLRQRVRPCFLQTRLRLCTVQTAGLALRVCKHLLYGLLVCQPAGRRHVRNHFFFSHRIFPSISGEQKPEFLSGLNKFILKSCG